MKVLLVIGLAIGVTACSSTRPVQQANQFCDLKSDTVSIKENGRVTDERTVERMICNDNKVERLFHAQSGIASECGEYQYNITLNNKSVKRVGYACKKFNGTWEIVPHPSMYQ